MPTHQTHSDRDIQVQQLMAKVEASKMSNEGPSVHARGAPQASRTQGQEPASPGPSNGTRKTERPAGMGGSSRASTRSQEDAVSTAQSLMSAGPQLTYLCLQGTPEQRLLVKNILKAKDHYERLDIPRAATEDDIKKSYRKLALQLHPDKNKAHRSDEAFKLMSQAFSCLSDGDKRAYYDRTGFENSQAAAQASTRQQHGGMGRGGQGYTEDIDPEMLFNIFFGGLNNNARVFRNNFGGPPPRQRQQQEQQQPRQAQRTPGQQLLTTLIQFLPIILLIVFSLLSQSSPVYHATRTSHYTHEMRTVRGDVPFYVHNQRDFESSYPSRTHQRQQLERNIESETYERLSQMCQQERMVKQRMLYR